MELPAYNPEIRSRPDLRSHDLAGLDLSEESELLLHSGFNTKTKGPDLLPTDFDPQSILERNRNPGLQLQALHEQGITGDGVGMAVIDYTVQEVNHDTQAPAEFHGSSMAPGAKLYLWLCAIWISQKTN